MINNPAKLKGKGDPRSDAIRSKIKGSSSDKRKISQRINGLKWTTPENIERKVLQLATDPKSSAFTIMKMIKTIGDREDLTPGLQIQLVRAMSDAHRTIYGTKQHIEQRIEAVNFTMQESTGQVKCPKCGEVFDTEDGEILEMMKDDSNTYKVETDKETKESTEDTEE